MEKVKRSDTWLLARTGFVRGALMLLWGEAWEQTPCGSLPDNDELIALILGMPDADFVANKAVLLRGWWRADDGRLYHDTITERVLEMLEYRAKNAKRVAKHKEAKREQPCGNALPPREPVGSNDTGTGTGTKEEVLKGGSDSAVVGSGETLPPPTPAGEACKAIKAAGIFPVNPSSPDLLRVLAAGVTAQELTDTATELVAKGKANFAYLLKTVEARRNDAASMPAVASQPPRGPPPASFRERDAQAAAARVAEFSPAAAAKPARRQPDYIDAEFKLVS